MKRSSTKRWLSLRISVIFCVFTVMFSIIILRAFQLQIIKRDKFAQMLEKQYLKYVKLPPKRGTIYDRKQRELAVSIEVDSVYSQPGKIENKREVAKKLSPILKVNYQSLKSTLASDKPFVWSRLWKRGNSISKAMRTRRSLCRARTRTSPCKMR